MLSLPYKWTPWHISTWPYGFLNNFYGVKYNSTNSQANNIIGNHLIKFQLDILTCHEEFFVLPENLKALSCIPAIFDLHVFYIYPSQKKIMKTHENLRLRKTPCKVSIIYLYAT